MFAKDVVCLRELGLRHSQMIFRLKEKTQNRIMPFMKAKHDMRHPVTRAVVEELQPRFVPDGRLMWVRGARETASFASEDALVELGFASANRDQFPNVVLHDRTRRWLVLVEVAGIRGPMSQRRCEALKREFAGPGLRLILINAFQSRREFQDLRAKLAWGTSAWFADEPDHMIHFGGEVYPALARSRKRAPADHTASASTLGENR